MIKWWTNFLCVLPISQVGYYTDKLKPRAVYCLKNLQWHEFLDEKDQGGIFLWDIFMKTASVYYLY